MSTQSNRAAVTQWLEALRSGDAETFWALQADDVIYNICGTTVISGRMQGKERMQRDVIPLVYAALEPEGFRFGTRSRIMCADEQCVTLMWEADGPARNGVRYNQRYVHVFEFRDGLISEVWEFFDTELANAALFPPDYGLKPVLGMEPFGF